MAQERDLDPKANEVLASILRKEMKLMNSQSLTLPSRCDMAYNLFKDCKLASTFHNIKDVEAIKKVQTRVLDFLKKVLDVKTEAQVHVLMEKRVKARKLNPEYMPDKHVNVTKLPRPENARTTSRITGPFEEEGRKTRAYYNIQRLAHLALAKERGLAMRVTKEEREDDIETRKHMYDVKERDSLRVLIHAGLLVSQNPTDPLSYEPFDTKNRVSHKKQNYAAFTINFNGEISAFDHKEERVAHSSPNAGRPVMGAGEMSVKNGKIEIISDHSGHYMPILKNMVELLAYLKGRGVDLSNTLVSLHDEIPSKLNVECIAQTREKKTDKTTYCYRALDILNLPKNEEFEAYTAKQIKLRRRDFYEDLHEKVVSSPSKPGKKDADQSHDDFSLVWLENVDEDALPPPPADDDDELPSPPDDDDELPPPPIDDEDEPPSYPGDELTASAPDAPAQQSPVKKLKL